MLDRITATIRKGQEYAKAIVAAVGTLLVAATGLSDDLGVTIIPAEALPYITFAVAALTAFSTWAVPNRVPEIEE